MYTEPSYFKDTYQFSDNATVLSSDHDQKGFYLILDKTIFHPQGGGQPADTGTLTIDDMVIHVQSVKSDLSIVKHYIDSDLRHLVGQTVTCIIDSDKRLLHAKLHTGGHLISHIIEKHYPEWKAIKGHHYPDQSYVMFDPIGNTDAEIQLNGINELLLQNIKANHFTVISHEDQSTRRTIKIGDFPASPCGGTHVKQISELDGLKVTKFKIKKAQLKINYAL